VRTSPGKAHQDPQRRCRYPIRPMCPAKQKDDIFGDRAEGADAQFGRRVIGLKRCQRVRPSAYRNAPRLVSTANARGHGLRWLERVRWFVAPASTEPG